MKTNDLKFVLESVTMKRFFFLSFLFLISHEHPSILNLYANLQIYNKYEHKSTTKGGRFAVVVV